MKNLLMKKLAVLLLAFSVAGVATAGTVIISTPNCGWVPGHWAYGNWVPGHRACWGYGPHPIVHGCRFVPGHWYYGSWVPPHRQCW